MILMVKLPISNIFYCKSYKLPKPAIVKIIGETGSNQDFEIKQFGVKNQDLFFQSGFLDTAYFFKQNKQQTGKNQDSVPPYFAH